MLSRTPQYKIRRDVTEVRANVHFAATLAVTELVLSATASQQHRQPSRRSRDGGQRPGGEPQGRGSDVRRGPITYQEVPSEDDLYPGSRARHVRSGAPVRSGSALRDYGVIVEEVLEDGSKRSLTPTSVVSADGNLLLVHPRPSRDC